MTALTLTEGDTRRLWLFTLNMAADELAALRATDLPDPVPALLGVDFVDTDFVEIFDLADLTGLGLSEYLITGNAIPESQIAPDRARLDALRGPVLILFAAAFAKRPVTLHPDPRLTLIGSYAEDIRPVEFEPLPDAAAKGSLGAPSHNTVTPGHAASQTGTVQDVPVPTAKKYSNARMSGMVATAALLVMFALVSLMIWIA